ncbi:unnamed protein product [Orchesella dallaii]|uniref:F-box domain-containing protein n=1 Tax=Orchesella dallaii TaxID=48710 RepID=A0ABP1RWT9_9HEXA
MESSSNNFTTDLTSDQQLDNKNPMLNHVIIKKIFDLIPFKLEEFKNFRLVSHEWNNCAVKFLHQNTWLKLNKRDETHTTLMDLISHSLKKSHELNPLFNETLGFKKYLISMQMFWSMDTHLCLLNFWKKFGSRMTHLEISDTHMFPKDLVRIMLELTPNLQVFIYKNNGFFLDQTKISSNAGNVLVWDEGFRPQQSSINKNLTHLTIMNLDIEREGFIFNWIDIICHFPNMKNLTLGIYSKSNYLALRSLEEVLQAVILVRQNCGQHYLAELEHLDIMEIPESFLYQLPLNILLLLRKLAFPLSTLALDIGTRHNRVDRLALKNTLELHSASLQNLTLYQRLRIEPSSMYFQLPHLTQLILLEFVPKNLYFLRGLPMLKTCVILDGYSSVGVSNMKMDWSATFGDRKYRVLHTTNGLFYSRENTNFSCRNFGGVILANLETLVVGTQVVDGTEMKNLAKLMPNIKTLQMGMGNAGFRMVCNYWTKMEHLHVEPMDINENGIFGVVNGERYRLPSIKDLKSLKTISLGNSSEQLRGLNPNLGDGDVAAAVHLPNLEAALSGTDVKVYRQPTTLVRSEYSSSDTSGSESD